MYSPTWSSEKFLIFSARSMLFDTIATCYETWKGKNEIENLEETKRISVLEENC